MNKYQTSTSLIKQLMEFEMTEGIQHILDKSRIWKSNLDSQIDCYQYLIRIFNWYEKYTSHTLPILNKLRAKLRELKLTKHNWLKRLKPLYASINPDLISQHLRYRSQTRTRRK